MINSTILRQLLNISRDSLFLILYIRQTQLKRRSKKHQILAIVCLSLTFLMFSAEVNSIFSISYVRALFRTLCYFLYIVQMKEITKKNALYFALFLNTVCTITHNFFLTPLTRPIILNNITYGLSPVMNWTINFFIVNICVFLFYFFIYKFIPANHITEGTNTRFIFISGLMLGSIYLNDTLRMVTDIQLEQSTMFSIYAIISQLTLFLCVYLLEEIQWKNQCALESNLEIASTHSLLDSFQAQKENDTKIRQIRHDLKNHLNAMSALLSKGESEECLKYIEQLSSDYTQVRVQFNSGNTVLDSVISQKMAKANQQNTLLTITADLSVFSFMKDADICILFSNLLDNALEATQKIPEEENRFISIGSTIQASQYICKIENSFYENPISKNDHFLTTKVDKEFHGLGLASVNRVVSKYKGEFHCSIDESHKSFKVIVSFPLQKKEAEVS